MTAPEDLRRSFRRRVAEKAGYDYPEAGGPEAHPLVREAVRELREDPDPETPLLYRLLGSGTPPYKMAPSDAGYQDEPHGGERCSGCEYAYEEVATGKVICSQIRGPIELGGWCRLFDAPD